MAKKVFIIVLCLITLALGLVTFFLARERTEVIVKEKQATEKATKAESEYRALLDNYNKTVDKIGYPAYAGKSDKTDELMQKMDSDIKKALANNTRIPKSYKEAVDLLGQSLLAKNIEVAQYKQEVVNYKTEMQRQTDMTRLQKEDFEKRHNVATADFAKQKADDKRRFDIMENNYKNLTQKVDKIEQEAKAVNDKFRVEAADAKEASAKIAGINTNLSIKLDQLTQADFDVPDGKILYVNQKDKTVRLNIGKIDGVRVLTKFGVFPTNTLDLGRSDPKGSIEIIRVLGNHESEAKIIADELFAPIMPGDMIYTPLWKVGEPVRFALGYHLDIDGDGKDDRAIIKDLIEANGSKVVLTIDENGKIDGKMGADITSYIVNDIPIADILTKDDKKEEKLKKEIQNACTNLTEEARLNNVREIKLSEFLRKVHYRKLANVAKYQEANGVEIDHSGAVTPKVSDTPIAPIYSNKELGTPPVSVGTLSPRYKSGKTQPAPVSTGRVSDYYFRKRTP